MSTQTKIQHLRHPDRIFIAGEWAIPSSSATVDVIDSTTELPFLTVAEAQKTDVEKAVAAARKAFDSGPWPRMSPAERGEWLSRLADATDRHAARINDGWIREAGTIATIAAWAGPSVTASLRFYAGLGESFEWTSKRTSAGSAAALLVREPVGVVAAIVPWNAAAQLLVQKVAPALIAGCTVIIKASLEAPTAPYLLAEACEEIGLPPGIVNVIAADREASEALVRHPGVDKVSFTGSTTAGRKIASLCGERVARVTLELGGKSPAVICDDFDVAQAAETLAQCAVIGTGQVCMALTRLIVNRKRQDEFVEALVASFGSARVGDPYDPKTQMGPLALERQRDRVESFIEQGKAQGARLAVGGGRPQHLDRGFYIEPTIFANVANNHVIAQEEIFGPVLSVIPVEDEEEAIAVANDTIYGLNASVFTSDPEKAYAYGRRIRAGNVAHNAFKSDFSIGFGGFKQSGVGREGGVAGLYPYLESKTMLFAEAPAAGS